MAALVLASAISGAVVTVPGTIVGTVAGTVMGIVAGMVVGIVTPVLAALSPTVDAAVVLAVEELVGAGVRRGIGVVAVLALPFGAIGRARTPVNAEMAIRLGAALSTSPEYWLNAQQAVDIYRATRGMKQVPKPMSLAHVEPARKEKGVRLRAKASGTRRSSAATQIAAVTLEAIVAEGLLRPPVNLMSQYRGQSVRAIVQADGSVQFQGVRCASPSIAAGMVKKSFEKSGMKSDSPPATNGWKFWQLQDPASNEIVPLDALRVRYLQRKKTESERLRSRS